MKQKAKYSNRGYNFINDRWMNRQLIKSEHVTFLLSNVRYIFNNDTWKKFINYRL